MLFFGKRAVKKAEDIGKEVEHIKRANTKKMDQASQSTNRLKKLLEADGITLRVYIATGGDRRHA